MSNHLTNSSKIFNYGVDLYRLRVNPGGLVDFSLQGGEMRVDGNLTVLGTLTSVNSNQLEISDNIITVNTGETGNGVTLGIAGLSVDRGTAVKATFVYDETKQGFVVGYENNELADVYARTIKSLTGQDLTLLGQGTNVVTVAGTSFYERQVFPYDINGITQSGLATPTSPDALVNAQALVDYVDSYFTYNATSVFSYQIVAVDDPNTKVIAEADFTKQVTVLIDGAQVALFTEEQTELTKVLITDRITSPAGIDLVLEPGGNVNVSSKRITNLADPVDDTDAVNKQTLENRVRPFDVLDLSPADDGAILVFNADTQLYQPTTLLNKQQIDAGTY